MGKKKTFQPTDEIVCVLAYPESGDQAWNNIVDVGAMALDANPDVQALAAVIRKAQKDRHKIGISDLIFDGHLHDFDVKCPCTIVDCVTIYSNG